MTAVLQSINTISSRTAQMNGTFGASASLNNGEGFEQGVVGLPLDCSYQAVMLNLL
jgi:hypothetical protein